MKMFYSLQRFVLLRRRQDLKVNIGMETRGILGSQTVSTSDIVLYSCHVGGFEGKHMQHFEMQKKLEANLLKRHSYPKAPVMPVYCF